MVEGVFIEDGRNSVRVSCKVSFEFFKCIRNNRSGEVNGRLC